MSKDYGIHQFQWIVIIPNARNIAILGSAIILDQPTCYGPICFPHVMWIEENYDGIFGSCGYGSTIVKLFCLFQVLTSTVDRYIYIYVLCVYIYISTVISFSIHQLLTIILHLPMHFFWFPKRRDIPMTDIPTTSPESSPAT